MSYSRRFTPYPPTTRQPIPDTPFVLDTGAKKPELSTLLSANPKTKEEFAAYSSQIVELLIKKHQNKPLYAVFVEGFVKDLAQPLKDVDVRKAASVLTTLANEKQKEKTTGKKKPKGAAKPALGLTKPGGRCGLALFGVSLSDSLSDVLSL